MEYKEIFINNERKSNKLVSKCMRFALLPITFIYLLLVISKSVNNQSLAFTCYLLCIVSFTIPTIIVDIFNNYDWWVKYLNITISAILIGILYSFFTYHITLLFIFPVILSSLFFDKKLSLYAITFSITIMILVHTLSYYLGIIINDPLKNSFYDIFIYSLLPRLVELISLSYICYKVTSRNIYLLTNNSNSSKELEKRRDALSQIIKDSASLFTARNYSDVATIIIKQVINTYKIIQPNYINIRCCVGIRVNNSHFYRINEKYKPSFEKFEGMYIYDKLRDSYEFNLFNNDSSIKITNKNIVIKYYEDNMLLSYIILEDVIKNNDTVLKDLFNILYSNIYLGIKNTKLTEDIFITQEQLIYSLAAISESKSLETGMHIKRVCEYTRIMGKSIGLKKRDEENLAIASMMHDVGKLLIPSSILEKPGKLTKEEFDIIKKHVNYGEDLLKNCPGEIMAIATKIALMHHEKWDGTGYLGYKNTEIDYYSRIVAVVDVFDALVSNRCYKNSWNPKDAYNEIVSQSGKHFDPEVVELFKLNYKEFLTILKNYPDDNI